MSPELSKSNYIMHFLSRPPPPFDHFKHCLLYRVLPPFMKILDVPLIYVDTEQLHSLMISPNLKLFYMARLLKRKSRNAFLFTQKNINNSYPSTFFCLSWILPGSIPMTSLKGFLKHIFTKMNF